MKHKIINVLSKNDINNDDKYEPTEKTYCDLAEVKKAIFHMCKRRANVLDVLEMNKE